MSNTARRARFEVITKASRLTSRQWGAGKRRLSAAPQNHQVSGLDASGSGIESWMEFEPETLTLLGPIPGSGGMEKPASTQAFEIFSARPPRSKTPVAEKTEP